MGNQLENKPNAPYAVASLILGILSLLSGCLIVGFILGLVGLILAKNGMKAYDLNPEAYGGFGILKAGKITSLLGLIFGAIYTLVMIIYAIVAGSSMLWFLDYLG
ncbi:MAG: hypothetical protein MJZ76_00575 [Bacteroidales bacterium]|nr:hypothetical protein [Bacteroidales bacterium]